MEWRTIKRKKQFIDLILLDWNNIITEIQCLQRINPTEDL